MSSAEEIPAATATSSLCESPTTVEIPVACESPTTVTYASPVLYGAIGLQRQQSIPAMLPGAQHAVGFPDEQYGSDLESSPDIEARVPLLKDARGTTVRHTRTFRAMVLLLFMLGVGSLCQLCCSSAFVGDKLPPGTVEKPLEEKMMGAVLPDAASETPKVGESTPAVAEGREHEAESDKKRLTARCVTGAAVLSGAAAVLGWQYGYCCSESQAQKAERKRLESEKQEHEKRLEREKQERLEREKQGQKRPGGLTAAPLAEIAAIFITSPRLQETKEAPETKKAAEAAKEHWRKKKAKEEADKARKRAKVVAQGAVFAAGPVPKEKENAESDGRGAGRETSSEDESPEHWYDREDESPVSER